MVDITYKQLDDPSIPYWTSPVFPGIGQFLFTSENVTYRWNFNDQRSLFFDNPNFTGIVNVPTAPFVVSNRAANTRWVIEYVGALGLGIANSENFGTVRTNSDSSTPTVYLKSEVDDLYNTIRPVSLGGTGADDAAEARSNLTAAQSGANNDITSLGALGAIPTVVQEALNSVIPAGVCLPYGGDTVPSGFIAGLGQTLNRADYPRLFSAFGTKYGNGSGDGLTFTMPTLVDVFPLGAHPTFTPPGGSQRLVGSSGGANSVQLSTNQLPAHSHSASTDTTGSHNHLGNSGSAGGHTHTGTAQTAGSHNHVLNFRRAAAFSSGGGSSDFLTPTYTNTSNNAIDAGGDHSHTLAMSTQPDHAHSLVTDAAGSHSHTVTVQNTGNGQAVPTLPKFLGLMLIVKT